jgi:hypothetical protein
LSLRFDVSDLSIIDFDMRVKIKTWIDIIDILVNKLAATDATAKNPMQATDATATPTDVLLGFVMRNPTCSHCSQNLQFGN